MTIKNTILISAATHLVLNFIIWTLGWMIWPVIIICIWMICGHLGWMIEKNFAPWKDNPRLLYMGRWSQYALGPVSVLYQVMEYGSDIFSMPIFPKFRNPFVWQQKEVDKSTNQ